MESWRLEGFLGAVCDMGGLAGVVGSAARDMVGTYCFLVFVARVGIVDVDIGRSGSNSGCCCYSHGECQCSHVVGLRMLGKEVSSITWH